MNASELPSLVLVATEAGLDVDQVGPLRAAAAHRELIHAQHPRGRADGGVGQGADEPEQRHPVHGGRQPAGHPGPQPGRPAPAPPPPERPLAPECGGRAGLVSALTCSTKVTFGHAKAWQRKRRTVRQMSASWPPAAVSSSRRSYRLCTQRDTAPHPGYTAARPHVLAWTRTDPPAVKTRSTSTSAKCGSTISATSRSHGQHDHKAAIKAPSDTPGSSRRLCQSRNSRAVEIRDCFRGDELSGGMDVPSGGSL